MDARADEPRADGPVAAEPLVPLRAVGALLRAPGPLAERIARAAEHALALFDHEHEHEREAGAGAGALGLVGAVARLPAEAARALRAEIVGLGHLGFLVPAATTRAVLERVAAACGLDVVGSFPSAIVARELGALSGRAVVDTTIVQLYGRRRGARVGVELFAPAADPAEVDAWIAAGTGTHVAFRARSRRSVTRLHRLLADAWGACMPPFTGGRPMTNPTSGARVLYYDLPAAAFGRLRVELYHEPHEPPAGTQSAQRGSRSGVGSDGGGLSPL